MNLPEEIFVFQKPDEYRVEGARVKFFYEEKKKKWGFAVNNIYTVSDIKEYLFYEEFPPCLGIVYGESYLSLRNYLMIKIYASEKNIFLLGPKSPSFLSPSFSFSKIRYDTYKNGNIFLITRSENTLDYGLKYLSERGFKVRYAVSLGESLFPFSDFFDIIPVIMDLKEIELIVCINETGTLLNLPSYDVNKPLIFLIGGNFLFEEESKFKNYLNILDVILPEKSIYELVRRGINVVYNWKDLVEILRVY